MAFDFLAPFTGEPTMQAAANQRQLYGQILPQVSGIYDTARIGGIGALQAGQSGALDAINQGVATGRGDIERFLPGRLAALSQSVNDASNALYRGENLAAGAYQPLSEASGRYGTRAGTASGAYERALGLAPSNDPYGGFLQSPGYQFALNQGLEAIKRNANARGEAEGGNAWRAASEFGTGLALQDYQNYLNNVFRQQQLNAPLEAQGLGTVGSGRANVYSGTAARLGDLNAQYGRDVSGVLGGTGQSLADLSLRGGLASGDVFTGTGAREANVYTGLAPSQAQNLFGLGGQIAGTYGSEAAAQTQGPLNLYNLAINAGKTVAGIPDLGGKANSLQLGRAFLPGYGEAY